MITAKKTLPIAAAAAASVISVQLSAQTPAPSASDPAAEIATLKTLVPDQAHVMADVGWHFTNAWFAGKARNWPLAKFFVDETRSHIAWAIRVKPVRKAADGHDIPMQTHADAVSNGPLTELKAAADKQDSTAFEKAYRATLTACYACHTMSEKPYLRLRIPERPATEIIEFSPQP
jgi:cytochrome c553